MFFLPVCVLDSRDAIIGYHCAVLETHHKPVFVLGKLEFANACAVGGLPDTFAFRDRKALNSRFIGYHNAIVFNGDRIGPFAPARTDSS